MKWLRYFVLLFPLIFSVSFSFSKQLDSCKVVDCVQVNGSGCFSSVGDACVSAGYSRHGYWTRFDGTFSCDGNNIGTTIKGTVYCSKCPDPFDVSTCDAGDPDDPCGNGKDPATCDMEDPPPDDPNPDDPCGNGKDPATCDMEDPPPDDPNPDDPCGNGKDPATCDMDEPNPDPETPKYDNDYKPEDPPCQIMVNGKCYNANGMPYDPDNPSDPNNPNNPSYDGGKNKICSNGYCKCFKKDENGILKEVPCNSYPSYDDDPCGNGKDPATCDDSTANDPPSSDDDTTSNFNPNSQYDDTSYNFDGLDTSTNLPDAKDIKDKTQEVDLSSWGVNDYFNSSGQCPAPNTVSLGMFGSFEVSYEYFCSIARILRTVVIAFAWLTGLLIIAKVNK